jgi:hypothetical protein
MTNDDLVILIQTLEKIGYVIETFESVRDSEATISISKKKPK